MSKDIIYKMGNNQFALHQQQNRNLLSESINNSNNLQHAIEKAKVERSHCFMKHVNITINTKYSHQHAARMENDSLVNCMSLYSQAPIPSRILIKRESTSLNMDSIASIICNYIRRHILAQNRPVHRDGNHNIPMINNISVPMCAEKLRNIRTSQVGHNIDISIDNIMHNIYTISGSLNTSAGNTVIVPSWIYVRIARWERPDISLIPNVENIITFVNDDNTRNMVLHDAPPSSAIAYMMFDASEISVHINNLRITDKVIEDRVGTEIYFDTHYSFGQNTHSGYIYEGELNNLEEEENLNEDREENAQDNENNNQEFLSKLINSSFRRQEPSLRRSASETNIHRTPQDTRGFFDDKKDEEE